MVAVTINGLKDKIVIAVFTLGEREILARSRTELRRAWSETTHRMQALRDNAECADQEQDLVEEEGQDEDVRGVPEGEPVGAKRGEERGEARERISSGGRRMCVTLTLRAETVDEVLLVYDRVHGVPELMLIL